MTPASTEPGTGVGLWPGGASRSGFLLPGQALEEVVAADLLTLASLGRDAAYAAGLLRHLLESATPGSRAYRAPNGRRFLLSRRSTLGWQGCPLCGGDDGSGRVSVDLAGRRQVLGTYDLVLRSWREPFRALAIPSLLLHLVGEHSFFEGGPYRVPPERLVRGLGIPGPGADRCR